LKAPSHRFDVEARSPDKLRGPLRGRHHAGRGLRRRIEEQLVVRRGCRAPEGLAAKPPVHAQGPHEVGSERDEPSLAPVEHISTVSNGAASADAMPHCSSLLDTYEVTRPTTGSLRLEVS
jgi:hypothetical protein